MSWKFYFGDVIENKVENLYYFEPNGKLKDKETNVVSSELLTIRSADCDVILAHEHEPERCDSCSKHRKGLLRLRRKMPSLMSSAVKKKRPHSSLTKNN